MTLTKRRLTSFRWLLLAVFLILIFSSAWVLISAPTCVVSGIDKFHNANNSTGGVEPDAEVGVNIDKVSVKANREARSRNPSQVHGSLAQSESEVKVTKGGSDLRHSTAVGAPGSLGGGGVNDGGGGVNNGGGGVEDRGAGVKDGDAGVNDGGTGAKDRVAGSSSGRAGQKEPAPILDDAQAAGRSHSLPDGQSCTPKDHLVFLKVHKAGSSTVANVIQRYGHSRNLNFVLPRKKSHSPYYNYLSRPGEPLKVSSIIPLTLRTKPKVWSVETSERKEYHLLWNHAIYDRPMMNLIMPAGTKYVAILREPFQRFVSALTYYRRIHANGDNGEPQEYPPPRLQPQQEGSKRRQYAFNPANPFSKYLHVEPHFGLLDYFRNSQSQDLGMSGNHVVHPHDRQRYLARLDRELDLVMILEFFEESLVLLRRLMCWDVKDVLYLLVNGNTVRPQLLFTAEDFARHQELNQADYDLYHFFRQKFLRILASQDMDFAQEVQYFKNTLKAVSAFCDDGKDSASLGLDRKRNPDGEGDTPAQAKDNNGNSNVQAKARNDNSNVQADQPDAERGRSSGGLAGSPAVDSGSEVQEEDILVVPKSPWSQEFTVTKEDCFMMRLPETDFLDVLMSEAWGKLRSEIH